MKEKTTGLASFQWTPIERRDIWVFQWEKKEASSVHEGVPSGGGTTRKRCFTSPCTVKNRCGTFE